MLGPGGGGTEMTDTTSINLQPPAGSVFLNFDTNKSLENLFLQTVSGLSGNAGFG